MAKSDAIAMRAESIASISPSSVHPEYAAGVILQHRDVGGAGAQHVKVIAMQEEPEFRPPKLMKRSGAATHEWGVWESRNWRLTSFQLISRSSETLLQGMDVESNRGHTMSSSSL